MSDQNTNPAEHPYAQWMEKIRNASNAKPIEDEHSDKQYTKTGTIVHKNHLLRKADWIYFVIILLAGLIYRLLFIFIFSTPENAGAGWNGDTYHHWQIAYLTYTVGLQHGFLRLWDLKGMEYFWGPLHPLLTAIFFAISGSISIVITRLSSTVFGLASELLLCLLVFRYWGRKAAYATLAFAIFLPIAVQSDTSGMVEPFGVFFMLLGIYLWPKHTFLTGIAWALATMVRAEAWLFAIGLLAGLLFTREDVNKKIMAFMSWILIMILYMKYLLDYTGNPIYPVWWNLLANGIGTWADPMQQMSALQATVKPILMILGIVNAGVLVYVIYKRPRSTLLLLLGFGNAFFVTAFMGFGHYILGWQWWFPVIRFFVFPYLFLAGLFFVFLNKIIRMEHIIIHAFFSLIVLAVIILSQWTWIPVMGRFSETEGYWQQRIQWAIDFKKVYSGGTVLFPEDDPHFTYAVVMHAGVTGGNILGQMYDPFFYMGGESAFNYWTKNRPTVLSWIKKYNIRYAIIANDRKRYELLIKNEPDLFESLAFIQGSNYQILRVHPEKISFADLQVNETTQ